MPRLAPLLAAAARVASGASAEPPPPCPIADAQFETAAPHLDLDRCPPSPEGPSRFRRAAVSASAPHVLVFTTEGAQRLLETVAVPKEAFALALM